MFTGIVREIGRFEAVAVGAGGATLRLRAPETAAATRTGDSVAVNGVCLTATAVEGATLAFDVVPETLARSTLGGVRAGGAANVEPALRAGEPLGGHIVQGHVDGVATVRALAAEGEGARLELALPAELGRYCVEKGSIAVEGVSLTIASVARETIAIALVPHTVSATTLGSLAPGDRVNVEVDVLAKHVERLLAERAGR
ncbi:MAG: riboflavin synthase [Actinobacteria bacterium]|nr:riboflavin synthase [Actinomycetota bacterium]